MMGRLLLAAVGLHEGKMSVCGFYLTTMADPSGACIHCGAPQFAHEVNMEGRDAGFAGMMEEQEMAALAEKEKRVKIPAAPENGTVLEERWDQEKQLVVEVDPVSYHHFKTAGTIGVLPRPHGECIVAVALLDPKDTFTRARGRQLVAARIWKRNNTGGGLKFTERMTKHHAEVAIRALRRLETTLQKIDTLDRDQVADDLRCCMRDIVGAPQRRPRK